MVGGKFTLRETLLSSKHNTTERRKQRIVNLRLPQPADYAPSLQQHKTNHGSPKLNLRRRQKPRLALPWVLHAHPVLHAPPVLLAPPPRPPLPPRTHAPARKLGRGGMRSWMSLTQRDRFECNHRPPPSPCQCQLSNAKPTLVAPLPLDKQKGTGVVYNTNTTRPSTAPTQNTGVTKQWTRKLASSNCVGRSTSKRAPAAWRVGGGGMYPPGPMSS